MTAHSMTLRGETAMIAIDALDKLSRLRALTDVESWSLERLIRMQDSSQTGAARLAVWRKVGLELAMHVPEFNHLLAEQRRTVPRTGAKLGQGCPL